MHRPCGHQCHQLVTHKNTKNSCLHLLSYIIIYWTVWKHQFRFWQALISESIYAAVKILLLQIKGQWAVWTSLLRSSIPIEKKNESKYLAERDWENDPVQIRDFLRLSCAFFCFFIILFCFVFYLNFMVFEYILYLRFNFRYMETLSFFPGVSQMKWAKLI